jgi:PAS domain S-box-containing protein
MVFWSGTDRHMTTMEPALVFAEVTGVIRIWNSGAEALFGHRAEDAVGRTLDLIVPPEYRERHWVGFRAAMTAGDGKVDRAAANVPAMHRDGTVLRVAVRLLVIHDARDRATGALAVFAQDDEAAPPLPRL